MPREEYTPLVVVSTEGLSEEEWLDYRRLGIGGSDAAIVFGVSPFATARDLYYDKLNIFSFGDNSIDWVRKEMGHLLEDLVAKIFRQKTDYRIYQIKKMFRHPLYPYMQADVDYFIELPNGKTAILEIKTTNYNAKDKWWANGKEVVPVNYELQGRHYMCVMNVDEVYYCCLYGNTEDEVIIRHITRDYDYEDEIIAVEGEFWNEYVLRRVPPPYVEEVGELIINSVKNHVGPADPSLPEIELPHIFTAQIERYMELKQEKSTYSAKIKQIDNEMHRLQGNIIDRMGKGCLASCRHGSDTYQITYNPIRKPDILKENLARLNLRHPEIYEEYVTVSEQRRFHVKKLQEAAA